MKKILFMILAVVCGAQTVYGQDYYDTPFSTVPYAGSVIQSDQLPYGMGAGLGAGWEWECLLPVYVSDSNGDFGIVPELFIRCIDWWGVVEWQIIRGPATLWFNYDVWVFDFPQNCPYGIDEVYRQGDYTIPDINDITTIIFNVTGAKVSANGHVISLSGSEANFKYVLTSSGAIIEEKTGTGSSLNFSPVWYPGTYTVDAVSLATSGKTLMSGNYVISNSTTWSQIPSTLTLDPHKGEILIPNIVSEPSDFERTYTWQATHASGHTIILNGHNKEDLSIPVGEFNVKTGNRLNPIVQRVTRVGSHTLYSNTCQLKEVDYSNTPFATIPLDGSFFYMDQPPYNAYVSESPEFVTYLPVYVDDGDERGFVPQLFLSCIFDGARYECCVLQGPLGTWFNYDTQVCDYPQNCPYGFGDLYKSGHYLIDSDTVRCVFNVSGRQTVAKDMYITLDGSVAGFTYGLYRYGALVQEYEGTGSPLELKVTKNGLYTIKTIEYWGLKTAIELEMIGSHYFNDYTATRTYRNATGNNYTESAVYYDGLGREILSVSVGSGGNGDDIVQIIEYDNMGRSDAKVYLPYTALSGADYYRPVSSVVTQQGNYYAAKFADDPDNQFAFSRKEYDGTTVKVYGPGSSGSANPVQHETRLNTATDQIKRYAMAPDGTSLRYVGPYPAEKLTVQKVSRPTLPEDQQSESYTYTNSSGQTIAKETRAGSDRMVTYYVYDDMGRQRYVIPPIQDDLLSTANTTYPLSALTKYCYYNEYDDHGRMVKQYVPGVEPVYSLYDKRGRIVMTQDGRQSEANRWAFTKYDIYDRPVMTGMITGGTYDSHKASLGNQTIFGETRGTAIHGYTNDTYPQSAVASDMLTIAYYDDYDWLSGSGYAFSSADALDAQVSMNNITGLQTGTKTKVLGVTGDKWLSTVTYYNSKYQSIQSVADLYPEGKEIVSNIHNFTGEVTRTKVKQTVGNRTYGYTKWFNFDDFGRLMNIEQQVDGDGGKVAIASYTYDDMGKVSEKKIHNGRETTSYTYSITGSTTAVNSPSFSYSLWFDKAPQGMTARVDGNLAHVTWGNDSAANQKGYTFDYDRFGQMASARYLEHSGSSWSPTAKYAEQGLSAGQGIQYDKNGNIKSLLRTDAAGGDLHRLQYNYADPVNGNALSSITMNGVASGAFTYDANGNMTRDGQTGVEIEYNILDLPARVFANDEEVRYIYSAAGEKLATVAPDGSLTYYRSVFTYAKASAGAAEELLYVMHPEGIVVPEGSAWTYKYFKTDHIGSTRVLLAARGTGNSSRLDVEQTTDFYPYGLAHGSLNNLHLNRYLYGGKEYQDAMVGGVSLGLYDFHARYYNPVYGRWFNPDPALQTSNPYLYCGNSPMVYVDKDGKLFWLPFAIGAAVGGTFGYFGGKKAGLSGFALFSYAFSNALIGGVSAGAGATAGNGVASSLSFGGFKGGFIAGAAGGAVGGMISGMYSTGLNNVTFNTNKNVLWGGLKGGLIGGLTGGLTGGLVGGVVSGIDAVQSGGDFWNGAVKEMGGSTTTVNRTFLENEEIPAGAKPTATGEIAETPTNPNYGKYGMTRKSPNGGARPHRGVDYAGEVGDDVFAMYDGKVTLIGGGKDYGPHLVRTSSTINGKTYNVDYAHMSDHSVVLKQSIVAGDKVGLMGRFGYNNPNPTHVHIAVWRPVNINGIPYEGYVRPCWK